MEVIKLDKNNCNLIGRIVDVFLKNEKAVIYLGDNEYVTYHSYIDSIKVNSNMIINYNRMKEDAREVSDLWNNNTFINKDRWKALYSNNDKLINSLKSLNIKKLYITGDLSFELYNYINVYGNDFEVIKMDFDPVVISKLISEGNCVLDTSIESLKLKEIVFKNNYSSLNEICKYAEYYYFTNVFCKENKVYVYEYPDLTDINTFTSEEQERINSRINYIFYLNQYGIDNNITNLLNSIYGKEFMEKFNGLENISPGTIIQNGICRLADSDNDFCRTINGKRVTTDKVRDYAFDIYFLGPCMIYGVLVDDKHTIPSYLQRVINENNRDYSVTNYGLRAMEFFEQVRIADSINIKENDKFIFIVSKVEKVLLKEMGFDSSISLLPVFNKGDLSNYFIDKPAHCNSECNEKIAEYIFETLDKDLKIVDEGNKNIAIPIWKKKKRNVFTNNKFLDEYLALLKGLNITTLNNGAILMNCNPFTYGHYQLIDYARKQVDTLIVMVVQEDKSKFSFKDRLQMVINGCKCFDNVVVIPSGKIFGSSMIFPEYFNRNELTNVSLDLSLDLEIFTQYIAPTLNIKKRFVGEEKEDYITSEYNRELKNNLPLYGIELIEIPRFKNNIGTAISAKVVRQAIVDEDEDMLMYLVPQSTLDVIKNKDYKLILKK